MRDLDVGQRGVEARQTRHQPVERRHRLGIVERDACDGAVRCADQARTQDQPAVA